jgi:hypothetical protein
MSAADDAQTDWDREFWLERRQALLIELAAIEKRLKLKRSIVPKRQRESRRCVADYQDEQQQTIS